MKEKIESYVIAMLAEEAAEIRFSKRHPERDRMASELTMSLLAAFPKVLEPVELGDMEKRSSGARELAQNEFIWKPIERVLDGADRAFERFPDDGKTYERWQMHSPSTLDGKKDVDLSGEMDSLSECAINYLQAEAWASSLSLEQWLVRRMIFAETFALSRELGIPLHPKSVRVWWTWAKSTVKWLIGVAVAVSIGEAHGWSLGVLAYAAWVALMQFLFQPHFHTLKRQTEVFTHMRNCYVLAIRRWPCPAELDDALRNAESKGAVWPEGLRSLVNRASTRNAHTWSVPQPTFYKARASEATAL
jgi:hypothetical protein